MATVEYDYDEMREVVGKLQVLRAATIGLHEGSSDEVLYGMHAMLTDISASIDPDKRIEHK